jgi:hypothetical protein
MQRDAGTAICRFPVRKWSRAIFPSSFGIYILPLVVLCICCLPLFCFSAHVMLLLCDLQHLYISCFGILLRSVLHSCNLLRSALHNCYLLRTVLHIAVLLRSVLHICNFISQRVTQLQFTSQCVTQLLFASHRVTHLLFYFAACYTVVICFATGYIFAILLDGLLNLSRLIHSYPLCFT